MNTNIGATLPPAAYAEQKQHIWKIMKEFSPNTDHIQSHSISDNGKILNEPESIANCFNNLFSDICKGMSNSPGAMKTEAYLVKTKDYVDSLVPKNIPFSIPPKSANFVRSEL